MTRLFACSVLTFYEINKMAEGFIMRIFFTVTLLAFFNAALAADWVGVGEYDGRQLYIDMTSKMAEGDIARVDVKNDVCMFKRCSLQYDCKRKLVVMWIGPPEMEKDPVLHNAGKKMCGGSWKFWK